ncbi:hypothetical protein DPMN_156416 [Dreissena polymorpha]|uniref:Uncharacterized protein n=1 Tax=Dreissena polymorpha TaxID=45954 RepID=A0A9D4FTK1_DREPO|nr:hypothetical protein DPMN_156416 [Dreissena polymorpha]
MKLHQNKQILEGIYHTHLNGIILRARAQHVEHNEKYTKYFANIEKRRSEQKPVHKLVVNGEEITNRIQILEEQHEEIKQSLFADDSTYVLNDNSDSFNNLIESLTLFGMASGLKLNKRKCTVLRKGKWKHIIIFVKPPSSYEASARFIPDRQQSVPSKDTVKINLSARCNTSALIFECSSFTFDCRILNDGQFHFFLLSRQTVQKLYATL